MVISLGRCEGCFANAAGNAPCRWATVYGGPLPAAARTAAGTTLSGSRAPWRKRWLAVWTGPDGRECTRAFAKKSDADRYGQAQETDAARGTYIDPRAARTTVSEWCNTWLAGYETRRPSTVRQARVHVKQIKTEFGAMALGAVRPSHVRSWTSRLRTEDLAASYIYALHSRLAQIMDDAVHDGLIGRSPCSRRTSPGMAAQRAYVATTEQVWALHDAMPKHLCAAILLGAFAGLWVAETCGLRVADVDFMRGVIHPRVQYPAQELKHLWPDRDESTRAAIDAVLAARAEQGRNRADAR